MISLKLKTKLLLIVSVTVLVCCAILFSMTSNTDWLYFALLMCFILPIAVAITLYFFSGIGDKFSALELGLLNYKDNEFTASLPTEGKDEFSYLNNLFNDVTEILRKEKQSIYQRELLLDKVIESSPIAMLLVDDSQHIIYANSSARYLLCDGKRIEGSLFDTIKESWPKSLFEAVASEKDGLFTMEQDNDIHTWHISRGRFLLNNQYHHLYLFKQLTKEIGRQEVAVWKKVIRVISHELNNSLAPISSMAHSGNMIAEKLENEKLSLVFSTIQDRVDHLNRFITGYAKFAKLPMPILEPVSWKTLVKSLQQQTPFLYDGIVPDELAYIDIAQMEQVLINLLKNSLEAGSPTTETKLKISHLNGGFQLVISDRGTGMSDTVLRNALVPFYSTKQTGTGLGLALCREIVEAHEGHINLSNRKSGGLKITINLPNPIQST